MYEYIHGTLSSKKFDQVILDVGGIGYNLKISRTTYEQLPLPGESVRLYAYLHVREDIMDLYGFMESLEREFFFRLLAISKVGPKAAMAILSGGSPAEITQWVLSEDAKTLAKTPGIGPTTAKRIILELKPKIEKGMGVEPDTTSPSAGPSMEDEALMALETLGYARSEVFQRVRQIIKDNPDSLTLESLLKLALKKD